MELLSSFAINIATGIALNIYSKLSSNVKTEIDAAFSKALKDWAKNKAIRNRNENRLKVALKAYLLNPSITPKSDISENELTSFLTLFKNRIPEYSSAFNYLKEIKDEISYNEIKDEIFQSKQILFEVIDSVRFDPRDIEKWLDELPFDKGKDVVKNVVFKLYKEKKIDIKIKETLIIVTKKIYERTDELQSEIEYLKSTGNNVLAESLERIKDAIEKRNSKQLSDIYSNFKKQEKERKVHLLKTLIESSLTLFAYKQTTEFFEELILLEPLAKNHESYAYFLHSYNFIEDAIGQLIISIEIYKEKAKVNPQTFLPFVAKTSNNIAVLYRENNNIKKSLHFYNFALELYTQLTRCNSGDFLPEIASCFNNLANLHSDIDEFDKAIVQHKKALEIRRELVQKNQNNFLPDLASSLNNLALLNSEKNEILLAKNQYEEALDIYRNLNTESAKKFLAETASILNNLAILVKEQNSYKEAISYFEEAIKIRRELAETNPRKYLPEVASALNNLANLLMSEDKFSPALEKFEEALKCYKIFADENKHKYLPFVALTINNIADLYYRNYDYQNAIIMYEEALKIRKELTSINDKQDFFQILLLQ